MLKFLSDMFSNQYLLLLIAAAIGNIKIKVFSLGSAAGLGAAVSTMGHEEPSWVTALLNPLPFWQTCC